MAYALKHKSDARMQPRVILAVDDDATVQRLIAQVLSRKYLVLSASDGKEATRMLVNRKVDLVLTDIRMPGMGGLELARHVRQEYPDLPVGFVSAWLDDVPETQAAAFGPWRLSKPFMVEDLMAVVERMLAASATRPSPPESTPAPAQQPEADSPVTRRLEPAELPVEATETPVTPRTAVPPVVPASQSPPARSWQSLLESGPATSRAAAPDAPRAGAPPAVPRPLEASHTALTRPVYADPSPPSAGQPQEESPRSWQTFLESSRSSDLRTPARQPAPMSGNAVHRETSAPPPRVSDESQRRFAPASAVGLDARHQIHSHVNQASLVWECRKKMVGGKPLMLPGENSPFESLLGPDDEVEVSDVDAIMLRKGDHVYCQDGDRLAFQRVSGTRVQPDGSVLISAERTTGGPVQLAETRIIGRVSAVVRKGLRIPVGALSICTRVAGWLQALGSLPGLGRRSA